MHTDISMLLINIVFYICIGLPGIGLLLILTSSNRGKQKK